MATVYLGLGSNLGDRQKNIDAAIAFLNQHKVIIEKTSSIIETEPVGGPPQDKFLNVVLKATTELSPGELLQTVNSIEEKLGRQRTVSKGPRTIDIDILLYDRLQIHSSQLTIPHPRMRNREFVMAPLKEIEPQLIQELSDESY